MSQNETTFRLTSLHAAWFYAAVLFNTMFAILSSVTLLGIVFITKPKQVLHNVPPEWWVPLMVLMILSQTYCQFLTWRTVLGRNIPSPLEIANGVKAPVWLFRYPLAILWVAFFLIGFAIVVSLYEPPPGNRAGWTGVLLMAFIVFALTSFANVYPMLLVKTMTADDAILKKVWWSAPQNLIHML